MKTIITLFAVLLLTVACSGPDLLPKDSSEDVSASNAPEGSYDDDDDDADSQSGDELEGGTAACAENYRGMAARALLAYEWLMNTLVIRMQNYISSQSNLRTDLQILQSDSCPNVSDDGISQFGLNFGVGCYIGRDLFAGGIYTGYRTDIDTIYADALISNLSFGNEYLEFAALGNIGIEIGDDGSVVFESIVKLNLPDGYGSIDRIELTTEQQWQQVIGASSVETYVEGLADLDVGNVGYKVVFTSLLLDSRCYFPIGGRLDIGNSSITFSAASCHSGLVHLTVDDLEFGASIYQQFYSTDIDMSCASGYASCIDGCSSSDCEDICTNAYCSDFVESTCDIVADECAAECATTDPFSAICPKSCDNSWRTCCADDTDCSCHD